MYVGGGNDGGDSRLATYWFSGGADKAMSIFSSRHSTTSEKGSKSSVASIFWASSAVPPTCSEGNLTDSLFLSAMLHSILGGFAPLSIRPSWSRPCVCEFAQACLTARDWLKVGSIMNVYLINQGISVVVSNFIISIILKRVVNPCLQIYTA